MSGVIGKGKIINKGANKCYVGTFPSCNCGEELAIIRMNDLVDILNDSITCLLSTRKSMNKNYYVHSKEYDCPPFFEDEMKYTAKDGSVHRLFLDRHFYTENPKDMVFVRYVSVDESFMEESP